MIPGNLLELIQKGKAQAHTLVYGGGAVGRLLVPRNQFIVITHFDYWHFVDIPDTEPAEPAQGGFWMQFGDVESGTGTFDFGVYGSFNAGVDFNDIPTTLVNVQTGLTTLLALGWTVDIIDVSNPPFTLKTLAFVFTTTAPGTPFNGIQPTFTADAPLTVSFPLQFPFQNGTDAATATRAQILSRSTHQLSFRSQKSRNHFVIQEKLEIIDGTVFGTSGDPVPYSINCNGYYAKDCYLVHTDDVQIDVMCVPDVDAWAVTMNTLNAGSQEAANPEGYGQGAAGQLTAREIIFDAAFNTQQYLPLTSPIDDTTIIPNEYRDQFKVDGNAANALNNPKNKGLVLGAFKTYPLVNIEYVVVNMNYTKYLQSS